MRQRLYDLSIRISAIVIVSGFAVLFRVNSAYAMMGMDKWGRPYWMDLFWWLR